MKLERGMIIDTDWNDEGFFIVLAVTKTDVLACHLYQDRESIQHDLSANYSIPEQFICNIYIKAMDQLFWFIPSFEAMNRDLSSSILITSVDERTVTSVLVSLSKIIIPKDSQYRIFMCADSGEIHDMGFWKDDKNRLEFIRCYEQNGRVFAANAYNLAPLTAYKYYLHFVNDLGLRRKHFPKGYWNDPDVSYQYIKDYEEHGLEYLKEKYGYYNDKTARSRYYKCINDLGVELPKKHHSLLERFESPERMKAFLSDDALYRPDHLAEKYGIKRSMVCYYRKAVKEYLSQNQA